nr:unnamed protein product [Digitaria exilis]
MVGPVSLLSPASQSLGRAKVSAHLRCSPCSLGMSSAAPGRTRLTAGLAGAEIELAQAWAARLAGAVFLLMQHRLRQIAQHRLRRGDAAFGLRPA